MRTAARDQSATPEQTYYYIQGILSIYCRLIKSRGLR